MYNKSVFKHMYQMPKKLCFFTIVFFFNCDLINNEGNLDVFSFNFGIIVIAKVNELTKGGM